MRNVYKRCLLLKSNERYPNIPFYRLLPYAAHRRVGDLDHGDIKIGIQTLHISHSSHDILSFHSYNAPFLTLSITFHSIHHRIAVSHRLAFSFRLIAFSPSSHIACTHTYNSVTRATTAQHSATAHTFISITLYTHIFLSHWHIPGVRRTSFFFFNGGVCYFILYAAIF